MVKTHKASSIVEHLQIKPGMTILDMGGIFSITETVFDPHYQRIKKVLCIAEKVGFQEKGRYGNVVAYTLQLEKPIDPASHIVRCSRTTNILHS